MISRCRFCQSPLWQIFCDLSSLPLANAYLREEQLFQVERLYPLRVYICDKCLLLQLTSAPPPEEMFTEYAYFSSCSSSWLDHAQKYAKKVVHKFHLSNKSLVVELASNDGYLLQFFKEMNIPVLGIEPAKNVALKAEEKGIPTLIHFFGKSFAENFEQKADLLIGNNVLAHVPDINDFIQGMKHILKKDGVITMEFPHVLKLLEESQFDTIYHEHIFYFSFLCIKNMFEFHRLSIFDVEQLNTHGGSLRIYAKHLEDDTKKVKQSVELLIQEERKKRLDQIDTYLFFSMKVEKIKHDFIKFLLTAQRENKKVAAYGAPAKGNTLLNYCKIPAKSILFVADRNAYKQGKYLPGTHIPIHFPEKILEIKPDFLLILPWNLKKEIMRETSYIRKWGGKFVTLIPQLKTYA
jgi:SAM-dependent methyltransferase